MKAVVWQNKDVVSLQEVPAPQAEKGNVLVRVHTGSICGSDITIVSGKHPRAKPPLILGHEFAGTVETVPEQCGSRLRQGQKVVVKPLLACGRCRQCLTGHDHVCENLQLMGVETDGGFTELIGVPPENVFPLKEQTPFEEAALLEPLAVAVHACSFAQIQSDDTVVIMGGGPIGLLVAQVARSHAKSRRNGKKIVVCEIARKKLRLAESLGFTVIDVRREDPVDRIMEITDGKGADVVFEASGSPRAASQLIPMGGIRARLIMVAIHKKPAEIFFQKLSYAEQTIQGVRIYAKGDFPKAIELLESGAVATKPLITHTLPVADYKQAFDTAKDGEKSCKVLLDFS